MIFAEIDINKVCTVNVKEKKKKVYSEKSPAPHYQNRGLFVYLLLRGGTSSRFNTASMQSAKATLLFIGLPV